MAGDNAVVPNDPGGASTSEDYGQATADDANRKELESMGSSQGQLDQQSQGQPPATGPSPMGAEAIQPGTPTLTPSDVKPGGPIFSPTQLVPARPWQKEMQIWASHPSAGPWLAGLAKRIQTERPNK
jgi:hypothetical protein